MQTNYKVRPVFYKRSGEADYSLVFADTKKGLTATQVADFIIGQYQIAIIGLEEMRKRQVRELISRHKFVVITGSNGWFEVTSNKIDAEELLDES